MRDQPPSTSLQRSLQEGSHGRGHHKESRAEFPLSAAWGRAQPAALDALQDRGDEGQELQMAPAALPLQFLALPVFAVSPELGTQRCVLSPELCRATFLCSKSSKAQGCSLIPRSDSNFVEFYSSPKPSGRD